MFKLNVLTPEKKAVFDEVITEVTVPAYSGEMTILPGHASMITTLGTGILKYKVPGRDKIFKAMISWGYCEVIGDSVNVLAEFMQLPEEISVEKYEASLKVAENKLVTQVLSDADYEQTVNEVDKAHVAIDLVKQPEFAKH
ncbi:MAG: ATP synthase F1 subunit epsilon [Bdellovibrionaceae bacterium]|nr:ATP synthase F1 subunit epsilon [Bdellovibrio sp.]